MSVGRRQRISVLIVAYQHEAYIARCIESVLEQQVEADLEVLIGEDGSRDGTLAVCQRYQADPRVQLIARGTGRPKIHIDGHPTGRANLLDLMARATGEFVIRVDGDDHWCDVHKLQRQIDALNAAPTYMGSYHHTLRITAAGEPTGRRVRENLPERIGLDDAIATLTPFHISSFLYRNLPDHRVLPPLAKHVGSLDQFLIAWVAHRGPLLRVDGEMSCYRMNPDGITGSGLFARSNDIRLRILLWTGLVRCTGGAGRERAFAVADQLLDAASGHPITPTDARRWIRTVLQRPAFFLAARHRLRKAWRLVRKGLQGTNITA